MSATKVSVIGAGIAGLTIADRLSQFPIEITLIDRNPHPGGRSVFYGCKATDSCVHCGVCLVRNAMTDLKEGASVNMLLSSSPVSIRRKSDGCYEIGIESSPNQIDWKACTACGYCQEVCPENAVKRVPGWKYYIDENCSNCGKCVEVCPVSAIKLERDSTRETVTADSVVVASGFRPFDPGINRKWGYGTNPRVIHGTDLERLFYNEEYLPEALLKAGNVERMAVVQCVGSRNVLEGKSGCSRVCCAYALRMANRVKQEFPEIEIDFYYMDIQHFGKNFSSFWDEVKSRINFIRNIPISIKENDEGKPVLRFETPEEKGCREAVYDMVSLSHGICPAESSEELADMFGLDLDTDGFFKTQGNGRSSTGIFISGTCKRPMRIDESVEDASSVSEKIIKYLGVKAIR